jgi:hypothetical protein
MLNKSQSQARTGEAVEKVRDIRPPQPNVVRIDTQKDVDPLQSFKSELPRWRTLSWNKRTLALLAGIIVVVGVTVGAAALYMGTLTPGLSGVRVPSLSGHVTLNSRPEGVVVFVDGVGRGVTPVEIDLPAGSHDVVFAEGAMERRLALKVEAGARLSENVDLPNPARKSGQLEVTSDPQGARVTLDGNPAGVTPLSLPNVGAGRHVIIVSQGESTVNRSVDVSAGASASVFVALGARGSKESTGWFALEAPVELRILENGQVLGLSGGAPLMLPAGRHQLEFVNDSIEMRLTRTVTVDSGKSARLSVALPNGVLFVNASPWAEVFVDGKSIGTTPLGSVALPVGSHELVARHPQLGEKRRSIVVGAQTPVRISMDMSR